MIRVWLGWDDDVSDTYYEMEVNLAAVPRIGESVLLSGPHTPEGYREVMLVVHDIWYEPDSSIPALACKVIERMTLRPLPVEPVTA